MKRILNGEEIELAPATGVTVRKVQDRLLVQTADGSHSALKVQVGDKTWVSYKGKQYVFELATGARRRAGKAGSSGEIIAPMPGLMIEVYVALDQSVKKGDKLAVLEAMKTQQTYVASFDGVITHIGAKPGEQVTEGQLLLKVEEKKEAAASV